MSTALAERPSATTTPNRARAFVAITGRAVLDRLPLAALVGVVLLGLGALVGALWPPLKDVFADFGDSLPEAFDAVIGGGIGTPAGWATAQMLSIVAPGALIAVAAISAGRATAGEEEAGTLGILLSAPVGRVTFLLAKSLAMVIHVLVAGSAIVAGLLVANVLGDMDLAVSGMVAGALHAIALAIFFGAVAITVGSLTGARRTTTAVVGGLAALSFATYSFLPLSDSLADGAQASPWYYFASADALSNGADWGQLLVLAVATAVVLLPGLFRFPRRDLRG